MKSKKKLLLAPVLSAVLLSACGDADQPEQRDTYASKEECMQDWNDSDLCEGMDEEAKQEYRQQLKQQNPDKDDDFIENMLLMHMFFGPRYYGSDRTVIYHGNTYTPTGTHSNSSLGIRSGSSLAARPSISQPRSGGINSVSGRSSSFGGFGKTGGSVGGGSGS